MVTGPVVIHAETLPPPNRFEARTRARLVAPWARLAQEVPVHTVVPPDGLAMAPSLVDALTAAAAAADGRLDRLAT